MSELSGLIAGLGPLKLRQSRAIARLVDRHNAALRTRQEDGGPRTEADEDRGYDFVISILAVALDKTPADIADIGGSITELPDLVPQVMRMAGFASGEEAPATSPSTGDSSGSITASPPATADIPLPSSAK